MKRREDKRRESSRKMGGAALATPAEARARLLSDARGYEGSAGEATLRAWISDPAGGKDVCEHWWRSGQCPLRRCKCAHQDSIAHLSGVPDVEETEQFGSRTSITGVALQRGTLPALKAIPLRAVKADGKLQYSRKLRSHVRQGSSLLFVALGQQLVYDAFNPSVFAGYVQARAEASGGANSSGGVDVRVKSAPHNPNPSDDATALGCSCATTAPRPASPQIPGRGEGPGVESPLAYGRDRRQLQAETPSPGDNFIAV